MPLDPYDQMFGDPLAPRRRVPSFTTDQETGLLGGLLENSLGGLAYLGKLADKTFGGRAVRGLLGGHPDELLSVLPFSDTLGLTDESRTVHGTDLTSALGLTTHGDSSFENEAAGFGAELLTDPSMWVGAAVPRLVAKGLGAAGRPVANAANAGVRSLTGADPLAFAGRQVDKARRYGNSLFDTSVAGTTTDFGQDLARSTYTPQLAAGRQAVEDQFAGGLTALDPYAKRLSGNPDQLLDFGRALYMNAELPAGSQTAGIATAADRLATLGFNPAEVNDILHHGSLAARQARDTLPAEQAVGLVSKRYDNIAPWQSAANAEAQALGLPLPFNPDAALYAPRTGAQWDVAGEFGRRQRDSLSGVSPFQQGRNELYLGLPGGTVGIDDLARDPAIKAMTDLQREDHLLRRLTSFGQGQTPAAWAGQPWADAAWLGAQQQAKKLSDHLAGLSDQAGTHGLFNMDFVGNVRARGLESARVQAAGNTVIEGLTRPAAGVADKAAIQAAGLRPVPVTEVLDRVGLTHVDAATGNPVAIDKIAQAYNIPPGAVRDLHVPEDVAADMLRMGAAWKVPESVAPVVDAYDRTVQLFKSGLTSPFPAFHVRNVISGLFNMWRAGSLSMDAGTDMLRVLRGGSVSDATAAKLFPGMSASDATVKLREMMIANNVAFTRGGQSAERVGAGAAVSRGGLMPGMLPDVGAAAPRALGEDVGGFLKGYVPESANPGTIRGVNAESSSFIPVKQGERLGNTSEDWIRGTHFLGELLQGAAPADAKLSVMKYQFDYGDLTQFEKNVMKRLFPWYTFSRKNLPPLLEDLANRPAKLAGSLRAATGLREPGEFVPPYVAEGASVPLPGAEDGQRRYISSFGLPFEDEAVQTLGAAAQGDVSRVFQKLFGMAQPFVKLPAELATGTQMYSGRKLADLQPYEFATLGGLIPEDAARVGTQIAANSPASRVFSSVNKLADERKGLLPTLANSLSGVRITDVDTEKVRDPIARQVLQDLLRGVPGVKFREEAYAPRDQLARLSPETTQTLELLKEIERRQLERARLLKAGQKAGAEQSPSFGGR